MSTELIVADKKYPEDTAINTQPWLDAVLDPALVPFHERLEQLNDEHKASFPATREGERDWNWDGPNPYTNRYWISNDEMQKAIADYIFDTTGEAYVPAHDIGNVYNDENDFNQVFQFQVWVKADDAYRHPKTGAWACDEWYYRDDVFVAIEIHHGGDVRGNYGTVQLRGPISSLSEAGFLEWKLGWYIEAFFTAAPAHCQWGAFPVGGPDWYPVDSDGEFAQGYHPDPTYHLMDNLKDGMRWSEKRQCFVGWLNGRAVCIYPDYHVGS